MNRDVPRGDWFGRIERKANPCAVPGTHRQMQQQQRQAMEREHREIQRQDEAMEQRPEALEHQLKLLNRCPFCSRSERVSAEEPEARIAGHAQEAAQTVADSKRPDEPPAEAEEEKPAACDWGPVGQTSFDQ